MDPKNVMIRCLIENKYLKTKLEGITWRKPVWVPATNVSELTLNVAKDSVEQILDQLIHLEVACIWVLDYTEDIDNRVRTKEWENLRKSPEEKCNVCGVCGGSGVNPLTKLVVHWLDDKSCPHCNGTGLKPKQKEENPNPPRP